MFSPTVMCGNSAYDWNTTPRPRALGFVPPRSRPPSWIAPDVGAMKPAIICSVVVLPQPDGPSSERNSPRSTASDMSCTAVACG